MQKFILKLTFWAISLVLVVALPFWTLVRGSVFLYKAEGWFSIPALGGGVLAASVVVGVYLFVLRYILGLKRGSLKWVAALALIAVCGYTAMTTFYFSPKNAKNLEVEKEFYSLHPLLRLGTGTLVLIDSDLLVTDLRRTPEDYTRMGLPRKEFSLHFEQEDGYAHALDIRTNGRSELANKLTAWYFEFMGFRTLRHVGTADHLHVSLAPHSHPNSL